MPRFFVLALWLCYTRLVATKVVDGAFIIKLSPEVGSSADVHRRDLDQHDLFHRHAVGLDYTVRQEYRSTNSYLGLSVKVKGMSNEEAEAHLQSLPGVVGVAPVGEVHLPEPGLEFMPDEARHAQLSQSTSMKFAEGSGNLASALQMGGVDKLHELGIKGTGIKIGIVDTGVDYRHPALGGGYGPGFKIAGGYSYVNDDGTPANSADPLTTCMNGGHGTHVSGILGMDALDAPDGFPIEGVAPEATLYMYRVFDCARGSPGTDAVIAAMLKAFEDGVDLISMSLAVGAPPYIGGMDPVADAVKVIVDGGVGLIIAAANDASASAYAQEMYTIEYPSTELGALSVGAAAIEDFPLAYISTDSEGSTIPYVSIWPVNITEADVYMIQNGCDDDEWKEVLGNFTGDLNSTIFAFPVTDSCRASAAAPNCCVNVHPVYVMGYWTGSNDPYNNALDVPAQARWGSAHFIGIPPNDTDTLLANYETAGGYGGYKLKFSPGSEYFSLSNPVGGMSEYFSSFGPIRRTYDFKPEISAPGGAILSTYPLGYLGGYATLSGTSMATPYAAGCWALVKSQFPEMPPDKIKALLMTTAEPMRWVYDQSILSATQQQGAGLVNAYKAITADTQLSPGHVSATDVSKTVYGVTNLTIENLSSDSKSYTFSHRGAGYMNENLNYMERNQQAKYGSASFSPSTLTVLAGASANVTVSISPPEDVDTTKLPVFGGFVGITDSDGTSFTVPYLGPPYSPYNTDYIREFNSSTTVLPQIVYHPDDGTSVRVVDFLAVANNTRYTSAIDQTVWSTAYRIDVLPADTAFPADKYGFDRGFGWDYEPSQTVPEAEFVGYASFGTLVNVSGTLSPANNFSPGGAGVVTTREDGSTYSPGPGDYRWLVGILRWAGNARVLEDWDTWLGPVIRLEG